MIKAVASRMVDSAVLRMGNRRLCWNRSFVLFVFLILLIVNVVFVRHYLGQVDLNNVFTMSTFYGHKNDNGFICLNGKDFKPDTIGIEDKSRPDLDFGNETKKTLAVTRANQINMESLEETIQEFAKEPIPLDISIPMIVHQILWADTMTFRNYLSVLSVWKILKPYQIRLYVRKRFTQKEFVYNDWYQKAICRISSLQVFRPDFLNSMKYSINDERNGALSVLKETGGVYVNINTIMASSVWLQLNSTYAGVAEDLSIGYLTMTQNSKPPDNFTAGLATKCVTEKAFSGSELCITIQRQVFPYDIMWDNSSFAVLARTLFFGKPDIRRPSTAFPPIPKIVHYVWFGSGHMDYSMYLSFLSSQRFIQPQQIRIYIDTNNTCPYLKKMAEYNNVEVVFYGPLKTIFQKPVRAVSHASDFLRADVLYRFGGVYIDWDVYWLKPIDDLISKGYETIASLDYYDNMFPRKEYPDTINMGVLLSRPGSRFIILWRDSYRQYTGGHHTWHAVENVYKLYEEYPDILVIDKRLQIMCHELRCHPLWLNDYKDTKAHHEFDFQKDVYAVHFTYPTPEAFKSEKLVLESEGYFADMARHILGKF